MCFFDSVWPSDIAGKEKGLCHGTALSIGYVCDLSENHFGYVLALTTDVETVFGVLNAVSYTHQTLPTILRE